MVVADQGSGVATSYQISPDGLTVMGGRALAGGDPHGRLAGNRAALPAWSKIRTPEELLIPGSDVATTYIFDTLQGTIVRL